MKKYCTVRFDDVCPTMDKDQFEKAFLLMRKFNVKPLLGIIPDNKDVEQNIDKEDELFWEWMRSLQEEGFCIAMHGFVHVYDNESPKTIVCGKKHSEFAGHSYEVQFEKIKEGKKILNSKGVFTDVFFAPGHSYDRNTLRALSANGFKYLCDGLSTKPYFQENIKCIPCRTFKKTKSKGIYISVNHPSEWTRPDKANRFEKLEKFCKDNQEYMVTFDELKKLSCGFFVFQKISEKVYLLMSRIKSIAAKMLKYFIQQRHN